ncbi:hypothetical protein, partial [Fervidicella metallireducens]|uniref:hypothetical protein n=1 Tax=Fervidicella metallireducens TaxID=655338 RepID=UPI0005514403
ALQLESGSIANRYNLVENGDFKFGTTTPTFWSKGSETDATDVLTTVSNQPKSLDNKAFKFRYQGQSRIVWKEGDISYKILFQLYSTGDSSLG